LYTGTKIIGEQQQEFTGNVISYSNCHFTAVWWTAAWSSAQQSDIQHQYHTTTDKHILTYTLFTNTQARYVHITGLYTWCVGKKWCGLYFKYDLCLFQDCITVHPNIHMCLLHEFWE